MSRSPQDIFASHLHLRAEGKLEEDIRTNYAEDIVIVSSINRFVGHDGVRQSAHNLHRYFGPSHSYEYSKKTVEDNFAFLIWKAFAEDKRIQHGVDSFLITDGKIQIQSIYYHVDNEI
ncbi:nuclear transport factor 2 family protein [Candidatus Woesebacteria bacterium]|nr:nuclear transport factor 2 family protein [Candidatus Woesebacteria bacterium]MCD8507775.1 nuclear transport factor 2 family protein [Candidatus Woesebacteria bacterium]MCD8526962.1 nuclear transport factor 2 family protein [Candidatus Woesebacteria bacterium]MCD8545867.1 nuclear transport factor 2 family protein [Candidatus Woesebacteria bacterium]